MLGRLGYLFICFLWLLQSTEVLAVSKDKKPILIICSYNPAAHQTSVTISDYMDEYSKLGGQRDIVIENMNCKSCSEAPLWSAMMAQILAKYQGEKHPAQIILLGQEAWAAYLSQRDEMQVKVPVKTTKEVPLEIIVRESAGSTLEQTKYTISPRSVTLAGEKEVLDGISAITLDTVYLQDISQSQTMYYEIIAPENTEIVSDIKNATVTFTVTGVTEKTFTVSRFLVERVKEGFTGQCVTESIQVTLRGLAAEINAITGEEIVAVIDFSSLSSAGEYTLPVNIVVSGYENVSAKGNYQVNVRLDTNGTIESERTGT